MKDEILINPREAKAVYFTQGGFERTLMGGDGIYMVTDCYDDENAIRFVAKNFEICLLGDNSELLSLYKNGHVTLVAALMGDLERTPSSLPVVQTIQKVGRYDVHVFRNANQETLAAIMKKTIALAPLAIDEAVVKQADLAISKPRPPPETRLPQETWSKMTRSLEKTPVRKRRNWSFPIDCDEYGNSIIKFEDGQFLDYTTEGVQVVKLIDPKVFSHNKTTDVRSAHGALIAEFYKE